METEVIGLYSKIVSTIKNFGGNLKINFLAHQIGCYKDDILPELNELEKIGVVKIERSKDTVTLH